MLKPFLNIQVPEYKANYTKLFDLYFKEPNKFYSVDFYKLDS